MDAPIPGSKPIRVTDEREAINGVAWTISGQTGHIAVSTRSEIKLHRFDSSSRLYPKNRFPQGAHGIYPTRFGGFIAPLGPDGLVSCHPDHGKSVTWARSATKRGTPYFYKLASMGVMPDDSEVFAAACRTDGLVGISVSPLVAPEIVKSVRSKISRIDYVSVCSIGNVEHPRAIVALGRDGSIDFTLDLINDNIYKTLRFGKLWGTAYKVLVAQQQLVILTSQGLYFFPGQVDSFLRGDTIGGEVRVCQLSIDAFDASIVFGQWLLVLTPEQIIRVHISQIPSLDESWATGSPIDRPPPDTRSSAPSVGLDSSPDAEWHPLSLRASIGIAQTLNG